MAAKSYPPDFIDRALAVLAACNGSLKAASRELGVSRSTLRGWRDGKLPLSAARHDANTSVEAGSAVASEYREIESLYKTRLKDPNVVAETRAKDAAVIVGIMSDKAVRAEGGSTGTTTNLHISLIAPGSLRDLAQHVLNGDILERPVIVDVPALPSGDAA